MPSSFKHKIVIKINDINRDSRCLSLNQIQNDNLLVRCVQDFFFDIFSCFSLCEPIQKFSRLVPLKGYFDILIYMSMG